MRRCPNCAQLAAAPARFCGRCGEVLSGEAGSPGVEEGSPRHDGLAVATSDEPSPRTVEPGPRLSRRSLLFGAGGLLLGGLIGAGLARWSVGEPPPIGRSAFGVEVGEVWELLAELHVHGPVVLPEEAGAVAIVRWNPSVVTERGPVRDHYGPGGEGHPVLDRNTGLLALSLRAPGSRCIVQYCESSGWFEDPCRGSRWNGWGEWTFGPAPRGLDRFPSRVSEDGVLYVEVSRVLSGPRRDEGWLDQQPRGPHCLEDEP